MEGWYAMALLRTNRFRFNWSPSWSWIL